MEMVTSGLNHKDGEGSDVWESGWRSEPKPDLGTDLGNYHLQPPKVNPVLIHSHLAPRPCPPLGQGL